jgi:hypothetical protein
MPCEGTLRCNRCLLNIHFKDNLYLMIFKRVYMKLIAGSLVPLLTLLLACQSPKKAIKKLGNDPIS